MGHRQSRAARYRVRPGEELRHGAAQRRWLRRAAVVGARLARQPVHQFVSRHRRERGRHRGARGQAIRGMEEAGQARSQGQRHNQGQEQSEETIMNIRDMTCRLGCALAVATLALSASAEAATKPRVKILATGGTIAGAQASQSEYGYKSGSFNVQDLINAVPQMKDLAD